MKIFIAAPNKITVQGIKTLLNENQYLFSEYVGRADEMLHQSTIDADLIILDANSPESFGPITLKKLKAKYPALKCIVINIMHHLPDRVALLAKAGANGLISKYTAHSPIDDAVKSVLKGKSYSCELCSNALAETILNNSSQNKQAALTEQEKKIVHYLANDSYNIEIADVMGISLRTVETHRKNIMRKLNVHTLAGITRYAIKNGLVCILYLASDIVLPLIAL